MTLKAIRWLLMHHSPLVIKPMLDPAMWCWGLAMLRNCTASAYKINKSRMVRVAEYSRDCLKQLRAETGIAYDERSQGTLQLFRTQKQLDGIGKDVAILKDFGVPFQVLDRAGYLEYEPALALVKDKFIGALRLPGDETGDCFKFTQNLAKMAEALGVSFRFGTTIAGIDHDGRQITGLVLREVGEIVVLADEQGKEVPVKRSQIEERRISQASSMPANLLDQLSDSEFFDLMAYLLAQRPPDARTDRGGDR